MTKFGSLKIKILHNLTESYISGNKNRIKEILKLLRENTDFKELYLFYEEIEKMYLDDKSVAEVYVESVEKLMNSKIKKITKYCKELDKKFIGENLENVEVYNYLDVLLEDETLKNVDKKILGRKKLVEFLTTKKDIRESSSVYTNNEHLLHFVLADRFNNDFEKVLNEEEKKMFSEIISMSKDDLEKKVVTLKEELSDKIENMILVEGDEVLKNKLGDVMKETSKMPPTKYNYYKLLKLRDGL